MNLFILLNVLNFTLSALPFFGGERSREYKDIERRAKRALGNRQWSEALQVLEEGKRRFSTNTRFRLALAHLYRQVGLFSQARENAEWVIGHDPDAKERAMAYRELAWAGYRMFFYENALEALGNLKERMDADWALEARIHIERRDWPAALAALDRIGNSSQKTIFWKGWVLWHMGRHSQARPLLREAAGSDVKKMFDEAAPSGQTNPWVLLGHYCQKQQSGQAIAVTAVKPPTAVPEEDKIAWELLGVLDRPATKSP
ncbi:MAG: tetratricopeptide repeat protein [Elusimicrobia bacterium]|nr:tetratricopeptide repeat protein [Elusimicrobiota bacterium]